jgi:sugar lactone lactonase YvrE
VPSKPRKPPIDPVRWQPPPVEPLPELPPAPLTVVPVPGNAPEDVVVDGAGNVWTGVEDGRIVRISPDTGEPAVIADTGGRPLGLAMARDGRLLICDTHRGLLALDSKSGKLDVLVESVAGRRLQFCSNVTEASDGTIYFTESTSTFPYEYVKGAVLEGSGRGSLFRLDAAGNVTTLVDGLYFANGVTLTADESALVFAETTARRLSKYWLTGERAGSVTPLVQNLPGLPDNISTGPGGRIWTAIASPVNPGADWLASRAPILRKLIWRLPYRLLSDITADVWVVGFDADRGHVLGGLRTRHPDFALATGVVEAAGRLWLACIGAPAVAYTTL